MNARRLLLPVLAVAAAAAIQGALLAGGVVLNVTPSLPEGFYRRQCRPIERGCFVLFRLPPSCGLSARPYARELLIKQVAAVEGDRVCVTEMGVSVNGRLLPNSAPLLTDRDGLPLPRLMIPERTLQPREVLAMSGHHPGSFDGRYFGPVPQSCVVAVVAPVLTW